MAEAMDSTQAALMVLKDGKLAGGSMPLMEPEKLRSYWEINKYAVEYDPPRPPPVNNLGQVVGADNDEFRPIFEQCIEYREWWIPNDLDMGALYANIARGSSRLAQIAVYRAVGNEFSREERQGFAELSAHFIRASRIETRVRMGAALEAGLSGPGHQGSVIVDRNYRILSHDSDALGGFARLGAVRSATYGPSTIGPVGQLRNLIDDAQDPNRKAGSCWLRARTGERVWIDIMPIREGSNRRTNWLNTDRPAALLQFSIPQKTIPLRVRGLAKEFGLTPAEEAVAVEIVKGDGRAATAQRLEISESTVRSHLSVIFEKIGIHRQSELIRLLN
ncbi:helix-turn-helix transcriptional regulator [Erythrobacter rubeus]|uniref:HTH luxR-type domain-containing protein n=1 Tax=Erythrobacter rubeus TaxID=2760803 RepID=A0ABR8KQ60_9SPHN|nr:helix-turn-helix transcriptional regulator [Erythrobacter rubeus]MBD2841522.1 hypothetical protein [Erythrobacter rubeus]